MDYRDVQKIIDEICDRNNIDSEFFIAGYTNTVTNDKIGYNFSNNKKHKQNKSKFGVLYYLKDNIFICWRFEAKCDEYNVKEVNRYALITHYSSIHNNILQGKNTNERFMLFRGKEKEFTYNLISIEELEEFIIQNA